MRRKLGVETLSRLNIEPLESRRVMAAVVADGPALYASVDPQAIATRDAAYWPFSSDSPWNTSIGSTANFGTIESPVYRSGGGAALNVTNWSIPVFIANPTDPVKNFYDDDTGKTIVASIHTPANAAQDPQSDGTLVIIDGTTAVEMWRAHKLSDGSWSASQTTVTDLTSSNVYSTYHGVRAGGMSVLAGLIRKDELANLDIEHALAVAVDPKALNRNAPGGKAFVWPASWADGYTNLGGNYSTSGNLYMGSLLAIPPSVNINSLGLSPQGLALAKALQNYGAYITETGGANIAYYAEPAASGIVERGLASQLAKLTPYLQAVTNNGPATVGGGGTHLPAAPPIGDGTVTSPPVATTFTISGTVTGQNGLPQAYATVYLLDANMQNPRAVRTNSQGHYEVLDVAPGMWTVGAIPRTYVRLQTAVQVSDSNLIVNFSPGVVSALPGPAAAVGAPSIQVFSVSGVVTDVKGSPVSGIQVQLRSGTMVERTLATDQRGRYAFTNLVANDYRIVAGGRGTGYGRSESILTVDADAKLDLSLTPKGSGRDKP